MVFEDAVDSLNYVCLGGGRSGIDVIAIEKPICEFQPPVYSRTLAIPLLVFGEVKLGFWRALIVPLPDASL